MTRLTDELKREHKVAEKCHICLKGFNDPKNKKLRDHCHYTVDYRGAAHNNCNLKYKIPDHIPIVFHNLNGYDAHLFIKELGRKLTKTVLELLQKARRNTLVLMLKLTLGWPG